MTKKFYLAALFLMVLGFKSLHVYAESYQLLTASNDPLNNALLVYNANGSLLASIPTGGKGGVPPFIVGGGIAKSDTLIAVINYNSQTVTVFTRLGNTFKLNQIVQTQSKPVSVIFGDDHLYILGMYTVESHPILQGSVDQNPDGSVNLLANDGSAAQVGFIQDHLIISERSNMIETVELYNGRVTKNIQPVRLPPPPRNNTPVGLTTRGEVAYVTIAHSDEVGLVKKGELVMVVSSETQHVPCWLTLLGPWLYCSNTPSHTLSRYNVTENTVTVDNLIAARLQGEPTDIDAENGIIAVAELNDNGTVITQFYADNQGNLTQINRIPTADTANGIAVITIQ